MKVILLADVKNIGKKGDTPNVSDGYATNFLIPRKLAVKFTDKSLDILNKEKEAKIKEAEDNKAKAIENKAKLDNIILEFTSKAAPDGRMIGSISYKQIEEELKNKYNIEIDKRKIVTKYQVNAFGTTKLKIELFKDIVGIISVHVSESK